MTQVSLERACIVTFVGESVATSMSQHVGPEHPLADGDIVELHT